MKTLLHTCCAPCLIYPFETLSKREDCVIPFFYNPNIHPYTEYKARRDCFDKFAPTLSNQYEILDEYDLINFCRNISGKEQDRCLYCYRERLSKTAQITAAKGFEAFTTTLLVSPYQNFELIISIGEEEGRKAGVKFLSEDFRDGFRAAREKAGTLGLYMQEYCGCIYSEKERYEKRINKNERKT